MNIRRLIPSDAAPYRDLMLAAYASNPDAFTSSVAERAALPISWWESRVSAEPEATEIVLGGFREDHLVGVAGLSFETREKVRHKATLFGMYVTPDFRQDGLGEMLVAAALDHARGRNGVRIVQLTVTKGNLAATSLYERSGFVEFGVEPFAVAVGDGFVAKVHMWLDLGGHGVK